MRAIVWGICLAFYAVEENSGDPILQVTSHSSNISIQFSPRIGECSAADVWSDFLNRWFAFFDVDHDGHWNPTEISAVPALPNVADVPVRPELRTADSDNDGRGSRSEFLAFYQDRGVRGLNLVSPSDDRSAISVGETLWKLLDQNRDARLSTEELATAPELLNRWDLDEDERLTVRELTTPSLAAEQPIKTTVLGWCSESKFEVIVPLWMNSLTDPTNSRHIPSPKLPAGIERLHEQGLRFKRNDVTTVVQLPEASVRGIVAARHFLLGEINNIRGDATGLDLAQIQADANLDWLAPLMSAADVDRDHRLIEPELNAIVNLLSEGAAAQVTLLAFNRGRNLFDLLDRNADGQLEQKELKQAKDFAATDGTNGMLNHDEIPISFVLMVQRGPLGGRFGRLRMARRPSAAFSPPVLELTTPRWFIAMDRNRDGGLTSAEFLGSPTRFDELDRNADGVITNDELVPQLQLGNDCL